MVVVEKAADVIPKVSAVLDQAKTTTEQHDGQKDSQTNQKISADVKSTQKNGITLGTRCPCEQNVPLVRQGLEFYCRQPNCPEMAIAKIVHFASKNVMDIEGLAEGLVRDLYQQGLMRSLTDIYALCDEGEEGTKRREMLLQRKGWGEKKVANLVRSVERSRHNRDLATLLTAMGVPLLGKQMAHLLTAR